MDLQNVLRKIRAKITGFSTVRVTAVQTPEQLLQEIRAVNPDKLPGVFLIFDRAEYTETNTVRDVSLTLVMADRFRADAEDKAFSAFAAFDRLAARFPADGTDLDGAFVLPVDAAAAAMDPNIVCLALGLKVRSRG